jgi:hypothetical protein
MRDGITLADEKENYVAYIAYRGRKLEDQARHYFLAKFLMTVKVCITCEFFIPTPFMHKKVHT